MRVSELILALVVANVATPVISEGIKKLVPSEKPEEGKTLLRLVNSLSQEEKAELKRELLK